LNELTSALSTRRLFDLLIWPGTGSAATIDYLNELGLAIRLRCKEVEGSLRQLLFTQTETY